MKHLKVQNTPTSVILCVKGAQTWKRGKLEVDADFSKNENLPKICTQGLVLGFLLFAVVKHSFLQKLSII